MSASKKFPLLKSCDFVEPPLKKCCFGESENGKFTFTESSEHLDVSKNTTSIVTVTESSEILDVSKNTTSIVAVTESSEILDVSENSKGVTVTESSEHIDVISFLSNNGKTNYLVRSNGEIVSLNEVRGKQLIICSVSLPSPGPQDSIPFWRVVAETYTELSQAGFEMVVSVTIKRNKEYHFGNFISKLPCLLIPYPDLETRNSVCSFINTKYKSAGNVDTSAIVVDLAGMILPYREVPWQILKYGFEWLTRKVEDITAEDDVLKIRLDPFYRKGWECASSGYFALLPESINRDVLDQPLSLHKDFLLCDPSRVLSRFDNQSLPVSDLSNKHVALYLCLTGNFMKPLNEAYKLCLQNNQELEVVLVCMPYFEEPKLYYERVTELLKRYEIKSWFIFPFDNKVCFRLLRAFCIQWNVEKLIILPPNCKSSGDMEGRAVIHKIGINSYPFTRSPVLEHRLNSLKSLTPASFFRGSSKKRTCLVRNGKKSNVRYSEIKGKKLILYLDWVDLSSDDGKLFRFMMKIYPKFQAKGCEVVFVPLDFKLGRPRHVDLAKMPWPIMPDEAAIKALVPDIFMFRGERTCAENQVIVFGEDGKIRSRWIKHVLMEEGIIKRIFRDYVREEIYKYLDLLEEVDIDYN